LILLRFQFLHLIFVDKNMGYQQKKIKNHSNSCNVG